MLKGIVIPADNHQPLELRELSELADYQKTVNGPIEAVDIPGLGTTVYVSGEGLLRQLPFNTRATPLWWHHEPIARGKFPLVGNAVVVGLPDRNGHSTDVPDNVSRLLLEPAKCKLRLRLVDNPEWFEPLAHFDTYIQALLAAILLDDDANVESVQVIVDPTINDGPSQTAR